MIFFFQLWFAIYSFLIGVGVYLVYEGLMILIFVVVITEPKGGSQEDFDIILKDYYHSISQGKKPSFVKKRRVKKAGINHLNATESLKDANKDGAGFLAVCRGKVGSLLFIIIRHV